MAAMQDITVRVETDTLVSDALDREIDLIVSSVNRFWSGLDDEMPQELAADLTRIYMVQVLLEHGNNE